MTLSLEGLPTKAKEAPSPHEVRLAPLDTNPKFHSLRIVQAYILLIGQSLKIVGMFCYLSGTIGASRVKLMMLKQGPGKDDVNSEI